MLFVSGVGACSLLRFFYSNFHFGWKEFPFAKILCSVWIVDVENFSTKFRIGGFEIMLEFVRSICLRLLILSLALVHLIF